MTRIIYDPSAELVPTYDPIRYVCRFKGVPDAARWWRLRLLMDDNGCLYYLEIPNPHTAILSWNDERDATFHPYGISITMPESEELKSLSHTICTRTHCYVDVLMERQPDPRWTHITPVGHHWHPDNHEALLTEWRHRARPVRQVLR